MNRLIFKNVFVVILLLFIQINNLDAGVKNSKNSTLFKIGRSKDVNEIYYEVKTTEDGKLDLAEPTRIY